MESSPADCFQCRTMPLGGWSSLMVKLVRQRKRRRWRSFRVRTPVVWNWPEVPKGRETGHPCVWWRPSSFSIFCCRVWDREALWIGIDEQFSCDRGNCDGSEYSMAPDVVFECAGRGGGMLNGGLRLRSNSMLFYEKVVVQGLPSLQGLRNVMAFFEGYE